MTEKITLHLSNFEVLPLIAAGEKFLESQYHHDLDALSHTTKCAIAVLVESLPALHKVRLSLMSKGDVKVRIKQSLAYAIYTICIDTELLPIEPVRRILFQLDASLK
jgi:hypothetical protein